MPRINFGIFVTPLGGSRTDITDKVFSVQVNNGREKYLDTYSGGQITFTINNANNYAAGIPYGSEVQITNTSLGTEYNLICWVQEITYEDAPGGQGINTATITAADFMSRAGRQQVNGFPVSEAKTGTQAGTFDSPGPLPPAMSINVASSGSSTASAITYTGTIGNYLNLLQTTERGYYVMRGTELYFVGRDLVNSFPIPAVSLARTTSTTTIAYQQFSRIQNGTQFINQATISSTGVADQTATNSGSVSTYGTAFYSSQTVDYNATQAVGNADWVVNNFSDPSALRFEVSFSDVAQNTTALNSFLTLTWGTANRLINLSYTLPGGSSTTIPVVIEGHQLSVTPEQAVFTLFLSPLQYYQFFTLDSSTLGILDTSRLGW